MCLIILANDIKSLSIDDMETAYNRNSDGFGVMYLNKKNNFVSDKFLPNDFNEVKTFFNDHKKNTDTIAMHFRYKTEGKINKKNCHPFISYNQDNRTIGMMHNGARLPIPLVHKNCSDTWHFNEHNLKPLFKNNPNVILNNNYQIELAEHIGSDKMIFLDNKSRKFIIINEKRGNYKGANWFSNDYWDTRKTAFSYLYPNKSLSLYDSNSFDYDFIETPTDIELKKMSDSEIEMFIDHCVYNEDTYPLIETIKNYRKKLVG
jgi:predicted glutamine amidotransferase